MGHFPERLKLCVRSLLVPASGGILGGVGRWKKEDTTIPVITRCPENSRASCIPLFLMPKLVLSQTASGR